MQRRLFTPLLMLGCSVLDTGHLDAAESLRLPKHLRDLTPDQLFGNNEFWSLPFMARRLILAHVDKSYSGLPASDQIMRLMEVQKSKAPAGIANLRHLLWYGRTSDNRCESEWIDNIFWKSYYYKGLTVAASICEDRDYTWVDHMIALDSSVDARVEVDPASAFCCCLTPEIKHLKLKSSESIAKSIKRGAAIRAALGGAAAGYNDPDNRTRAKREAQHDAEKIHETASDRSAGILNQSLKRNTLRGGSRADGLVAFERGNGKFFVSGILLGPLQFEFLWQFV